MQSSKLKGMTSAELDQPSWQQGSGSRALLGFGAHRRRDGDRRGILANRYVRVAFGGDVVVVDLALENLWWIYAARQSHE